MPARAAPRLRRGAAIYPPQGGSGHLAAAGYSGGRARMGHGRCGRRGRTGHDWVNAPAVRPRASAVSADANGGEGADLVLGQGDVHRVALTSRGQPATVSRYRPTDAGANPRPPQDPRGVTSQASPPACRPQGEASSCDVRAVALVRPRRSHRRRRGASSSTLPGPEVPTSLESLARKLADLAEDPVRHVTLKADLEPRPRVRPEHDAPRVLRRRLRRALRPGGPRRRRRQGGGRGRPPPDHAPSEFLDALVADREFLLERSVPCAHDRLEPGTAEGQLREVVGRRDDLAHVATCSRGSRPGGGGCSAGPGCSRRYARRATRISPDIDRSCARAEASSAARSGGSTNAETYLSLTRPCSSL